MWEQANSSRQATTISTDAGFEGRYLGADAYMDNKTAAQWTFTKVDDSNTYTIQTGNQYLTYMGNVNVDKKTTVPSDEAGYWQLIKREQLVSRLDEATPIHPMDASFYMTNPKVRRNWPKAIEGTDLSDNGSFNTNAEGLYDGGCASYGQWHKTFDNYQTLTGVKNGVYSVSVKGFYRVNSNYPSVPYLYANDVQTPLKKKGDIGTDNAKNATIALVDDTYLVDPIIVTVTDGTLRVGVKSDADVDWATFREFTIKYLGDEETYKQYMLRGDVNNNGSVDITDVVELVNIILNSQGENPRADVNNDGNVDISDVVKLVNIILNHE